MSVATVTSSPPPPTAHTSYATLDPVTATDLINTTDDPFAHYIRSSISSRAPPRALSPRIYGRSPRLPSALPLSASPRFVEPVTPDRLSTFPLFASDEVIDLSARTEEVVVDPASESERLSRVEGRLRWARSLPPFRPPVQKNDDVVDDDDAAKLFMSVPRKYRSGSSAPPIPTMNVPDFLCPPNPNCLSQSSVMTATKPNISTISIDDGNCNEVISETNKHDTSEEVPSGSTMFDSKNANTSSVGVPATSVSLPGGVDSHSPKLPSIMPDKLQNDVPTLQLPELMAMRPQPMEEAGAWDATFVRSPSFSRSPGILDGAFPHDPFCDVDKEEVKSEIKMEITETPTLSLPSSNTASESHHADSKPPFKRPLTPQAPEKSKVKVRKAQGHKPPTHPSLRSEINESPCCNICGATFARKSNLNKHLRSVHEDVRKFPCELCSLKFKRQDHLIKHKRSVHAKLRKFTCDLCGIGFAEKFNRDKHRRNIHNNKRAFQCGCGAYFQDREKMLNCLKCKELKQMNVT